MEHRSCNHNPFPWAICPECGNLAPEISRAEVIEIERIFSDMLCSGVSMSAARLQDSGSLEELLSRNPGATYHNTGNAIRIQLDDIQRNSSTR